MAAARPARVWRSPVDGRVVTQGQYRRELAAARGTTRYARVQQIADVKRTITRYTPHLTSRQRGDLAAAIVDERGRWTHIFQNGRGALPGQGKEAMPERLTRHILAMERVNDDNRYNLWRMIYR